VDHGKSKGRAYNGVWGNGWAAGAEAESFFVYFSTKQGPKRKNFNDILSPVFEATCFSQP